MSRHTADIASNVEHPTAARSAPEQDYVGRHRRTEEVETDAPQ